jgi:SAM-dependent methyltransferase
MTHHRSPSLAYHNIVRLELFSFSLLCIDVVARKGYTNNKLKRIPSTMLGRQSVIGLLLALSCHSCEAFVPATKHPAIARFAPQNERKSVSLQMGMDMVTYLRTEWISAALCTNQTPGTADTCLQLGSEDGRCVNFLPRTIREIITSTVEADGVLPVAVRRQLKQQQDRRGAARVTYYDQRADDLKDLKDESVDIVISLQATARMLETGLDWKKSVREAARVLKPGGRLLFVEQTLLEGESYLDYVDTLGTAADDGEITEDGDEEVERFPVFEEVGYDDVDLVLIPYVAGVALKSMDAGLTKTERVAKEKNAEKAEKNAERDKIADLSILAYERGIKRRKRKKKGGEEETEAKAIGK